MNALKNVYHMKASHLLIAILFILTTFLTGCELIGDIFEAGVWVGIIVVVAVVGLVLWLIGKIGKRS